MTYENSTETPRLICLYLSEKGRLLANRISSTTVALSDVEMAEIFSSFDQIVFVTTAAIAVRSIAPHIRSKSADPSVVCADEEGYFAIPLLGGHHGANTLARTIAATIGSQAIITNPSDRSDTYALNSFAGFHAVGDVAHIQAQINSGVTPKITKQLDWPLPAVLSESLTSETGPEIVLSIAEPDLSHLKESGIVQLIPEALVVGVGCSSDATPEEVSSAIALTMSEANLADEAISNFATIDIRKDHPAITALNRPTQFFTSSQLAEIAVPNPSDTVRESVGSASVAEAAAILSSRSIGSLISPKRKFRAVTVAVAQRATKLGRLFVVGLGPGNPDLRTYQAAKIISHAEVVTGFGPYVDLCSDLLTPNQKIKRFPIGEETERVDFAIHSALSGDEVALVCSGDPGVFAMASLAFERANLIGFDPNFISVIPGVTAALASSAVAGAILGHDHVYISLSDLMTPWPVIEKRVSAAAEADLVTAFYNPKSRRRVSQLTKAIAILSQFRPPSTPVVIAKAVGRDHQSVEIVQLQDFHGDQVDMETLVIVGSTTSTFSGSRAYTPRGYGDKQ